jgi:hypothetical protein
MLLHSFLRTFLKFETPFTIFSAVPSCDRWCGLLQQAEKMYLGSGGTDTLTASWADIITGPSEFMIRRKISTSHVTTGPGI